MLSLKKPKKIIRGFLVIASCLLILLGGYLLILVVSPVYIPSQPGTGWNEPVKAPQVKDDRVYIPRLSLNLTYRAGDENVLNDGLWHRYADRGNPETGGNFILAGHRFELAPTPQETRRKSPLYHMDKIQVGDFIYADFNGKRYQYKVARNYSVRPTQTEIEAPSTVAKMTLYTCTLGGSTDGREVLEAKLIKQINPDASLVNS